MIFNVDNAAALSVALKSASAGDTITLASGEYSSVTISGINPTGNVTITSADPSKPVVIDDLTVKGSSNLTLTNFEIAVQKDDTGVTVGSSSHITLDHMNIHGDTTADSLSTLTERGISLRSSDNVTITNTDFHDLYIAIGHNDSDHLTIDQNAFHHLRMDAIRGGGSSYVEIKGNFFTDFEKRDGDHGDAIQFWTTNTTSSAHDITIEDNVMVRGDGDRFQGIFMADSVGGLPYENVLVKDNVMSGTMYNGIAINGDHLTLIGNTVSGYADQLSWIKVVNATTLVASDNHANRVFLDGASGSDNTAIDQAPVGDDAVVTAWLQAHPDVLGALADEMARAAVDLPAAASTSGDVVTLTSKAGVVDATLAVTDPAGGDPTYVLFGDSHGNTLVGTAHNELLDGMGGKDTMTGGAGDDIYVVDNKQDVVIENPGEGIDTVRASISSYTLGSNVENLTLTGTSTQDGVGNSLGNVLTSNGVGATLNGLAGDDTLVSIGGADTLTGGAGADVFRFDALPQSGVVEVKDFTAGQDHLDLHDLLGGYSGSNAVADGYVYAKADPTGGVTIYVDADGHGAAAGMAVAHLSGVGAAPSAQALQGWLI